MRAAEGTPMPSNKQELAQRQALAQPRFSTRGLFFNAIFKLVDQHAGPAGSARVRVGPLAEKLWDLRSYPITDFLTLLYSAADALEPTFGSPERVFMECGSTNVSHFPKSGAGHV